MTSHMNDAFHNLVLALDRHGISEGPRRPVWSLESRYWLLEVQEATASVGLIGFRQVDTIMNGFTSLASLPRVRIGPLIMCVPGISGFHRGFVFNPVICRATSPGQLGALGWVFIVLPLILVSPQRHSGRGAARLHSGAEARISRGSTRFPF